MKPKINSTLIVIIAAVPILVGAGVYALSHFDILGSDDRPGVHEPDDQPGHGVASLYTCPMHPQVVQEEAGSCPICKMDLVPLKGSRAGGAGAAHSHGSH
jgi:hypothetical protein